MLTISTAMYRFSARIWRLLGRGARSLRRHQLAARAYGVAAQIAPHRAVYHHDLGTALATLKRNRAAIQAFHQALVLDPELGRSQLALGRMYRRLNQHPESARAFARAIELLPEDALLFHDLGVSLSQLGRHDGAAQALTQAVRLQPGQVGWYRTLGRSLRACGQHDDAAIALGKVSRLRPEDAQAHFEHAREWIACNQHQKALEPLQRALALEPGHADSALAVRLCLEAVGWHMPHDSSMPAIAVVTLVDGWQQRVLNAESDWLCLSHVISPDKQLLHALYRRADTHVGMVTEHADGLGTLLCRTELLQACLPFLPAGPALLQLGPWLQGRLCHRSLQSHKELQLPATTAPDRAVWVIHHAAQEQCMSIATAYQQLGYRPHLFAQTDLPDATAPLREQLLSELPVLVHDLTDQPWVLDTALDGLSIRLLREMSSGNAGAALGYCTSESVPDSTAIAYRRVDVGLPDALQPLIRVARYRVGCVVGGGIGNMIQCSPAIRRLSDTLSQPVDVLLTEDSPGCASLFAGAPHVATVFSCVADARDVHFDLLVVLDPFSHQLPPLNADRIAVPRLTLPLAAMQYLHEAEYHLKGLQETLGIPYLPEMASNYFIGRYHRQSGFPRRVGLHAGCKAGRWEAKRWPYFQELAQRLTALGLEVVSFGGPGEAVPGTEDCTGLPLHASIEAIATCSYFISNDSGLMHIADALGIPMTSIFAPSSVIKNGPLAASSQVVQLHKACAPCQFDKTLLNTCKCIGEISLEQVWKTVMQHLRSLPPLNSLLLPTVIATHTVELIATPPLEQRLRRAASPEDSVEQLLNALQQKHYDTRLIELLISIDSLHQARVLLCQALNSTETMLALGSEPFNQLLHFTWVLAAQKELVPAVIPLLRAYPDRVLALCECSATVLEPAELDALLLGCAQPILASNQPTALLRLITAGCHHASPAVLVKLLTHLDASKHVSLLQNPSLVSQVGDALLGSDITFRLPCSGLLDSDCRPHAPLERLVENALLRQDRHAFIAHVNAYLGQHRGAEGLTRLLKNFTQNTAPLNLASGDIHYSRFDSYQHNLLLAIHLHDHAMIEQISRHCVPDAMAIMLKCSRQHDYAPLNAALARWLTAAGASPVVLQGNNRLELFQACLGTWAPAATDHGLVSVILCVHAPEAELLQLAVDSVLGQTYRNLELILVDDGNEPASEALIASLSSHRVRVLRSPQNIGVYQCRNLGVAAAQGTFITFHDADDVAHPQRVDLQLSALLNTPGCQLCYASHMRFDTEGGLQLEINPDRLNVMGDGPVTALLRRSTLETVGPLVNVRTRGDIELRQRIQKCYGPQAILQLDVPLLYCAGGAATLSNRSMTRYRQDIRLLRRAFNLRAWPRVVDGTLLSLPLGELAIPPRLRGGHETTSDGAVGATEQRAASPHSPILEPVRYSATD